MLSEKHAAICCLIVVALCYANSLPNDFVFDDVPMVASNPAIRAVTPIQFLKSPYWPEQQHGGIYRPFTILSLSADYAIWKRWAPGFRLTNLLLHAFNGWLVFLLALSLAGESIIAVPAMLIYLVHPVHTEAVTTIVGRGELLAAAFFLSAWLLFRRGQTGWATLLFFVSLLSKEHTIILPAVLALDIWLSNNSDFKKVLPAWKRLAAVFGAAKVYLVMRFLVLGGIGVPAAVQYMSGRMSLAERWMTSGRVFIQYLWLLFVPVNLAGDYDFNAIPIAGLRDWDAWIGLLLIATTIAVAYFYRRRDPVISLALLFAIVAFIPVSNWIMPISVLMAERFLYLPLAGLSLAGGVLVSKIEDHRIRRLIGAGGLAAALILCVSHNYIWRNNFTFYGNMVRVQPNNVKGRIGYGAMLVDVGHMQEAADQVEAGLRIFPDNPALISTLALTKVTRTSCAEARPLLNRALEIDPNNGDTLRRVADCLFREGQMREAESAYRRALQQIPFPDPLLLIMWGKSLEDTGQKSSAIAAYQRASDIEPNNVPLRQKLASLRTN